MRALIESELYDAVTPDAFAERIKTPADALDMGIRFEKDAILFFNGLSRFVDEKSKKIAGKLIEEEQEHMLYLFNKKKELAG